MFRLFSDLSLYKTLATDFDFRWVDESEILFLLEISVFIGKYG